MAEKGLSIANQIAGASIATRNAYELDDESNIRVIPRILPVCHHAPDPFPILRSGITDIDSRDLSSLIPDITDNIIICGDKTRLIAHVDFASFANQDICLTPILFDDEASPGIVGILETMCISVTMTDNITRSTGANMLARAQIWNLYGAVKVGMMITDYVTITTTATVYGYVI